MFADSRIDRRRFLLAGAASAGLLASGRLGVAVAKAADSGTTTLNWLTWSDHYLPAQLAAVRKQTQISARPQLFSDDIDGYLKVKEDGSQFDILSEDALWVDKCFNDGLTAPFDFSDIPASAQLYSVAKEMPFWQHGSQTLCYPYGWSSEQIYYNTKHVTTKPDSWQALLNPAYKKKIILANQPTDIMVMAGLATGAKKPATLTKAEISTAKDFLRQLKPNVLKLAAQNTDQIAAMVSEEAWLTIDNLGTDALVKNAGGPVVGGVTPKEGTYGWMDGEQLVKQSPNRDAFLRFLNAMEQGTWLAQSFIVNGHPFFNEKAYKILVNRGKKELADRYHYNDPEITQSMILKGPQPNIQQITDAFNEVFAA
jgi:spermidine/putrescine transport system substrate-binding protein